MQTRSLLLISFLVIFLIGAQGWADTVDYNINGQFGFGFVVPAGTGALVAEGAPFSMSFTLVDTPAPLAGDPTCSPAHCFGVFPVDLAYTYDGTTTDTTARLVFY